MFLLLALVSKRNEVEWIEEGSKKLKEQLKVDRLRLRLRAKRGREENGWKREIPEEANQESKHKIYLFLHFQAYAIVRHLFISSLSSPFYLNFILFFLTLAKPVRHLFHISIFIQLPRWMRRPSCDRGKWTPNYQFFSPKNKWLPNKKIV